MSQEANQKVVESRARLEAMPVERIHRLCDFLVSELGRPATDIEAQAIAKLLGQHYDEAKALCLHDPCSPFLAAISCLASAYRSPMVADSVLRDASRWVSEVAKQRSATRIAEGFQKILAE